MKVKNALLSIALICSGHALSMQEKAQFVPIKKHQDAAQFIKKPVVYTVGESLRNNFYKLASDNYAGMVMPPENKWQSYQLMPLMNASGYCAQLDFKSLEQDNIVMREASAQERHEMIEAIEKKRARLHIDALALLKSINFCEK